MTKFKLLLLSFCLPFLIHAQSVTGKITNAGTRADAGTKVYLVKYDETNKALYDTLNNFLDAKKYRVLYADNIEAYNANKKIADGYEGKKRFQDEYAAMKPIVDREKLVTDDYKAKIEATGAVTKARFDSLDSHASGALSKIKYYPGNMNGTVDDSGNYNISAASGDYIVLIISNNRTGITSTEIYGKIFIQHIQLAENETKNISTKFIAD